MGYSWLGSFFTYFRLQYLGIQIIAFMWATLDFLIFSRRHANVRTPLPRLGSWLSLVLLMVCMGLNLWVIMPYYQSANRLHISTSTTAATKKPFRLLHLNLMGPLNRNFSSVSALLRETKPDLVDLVEYTPVWRRNLEAGYLKTYPYRSVIPGHVALYSRFPLQSTRHYPKGMLQVPNQAYLLANVRLKSSLLTVLVAHPASPMLPQRWQWQQALFADWVRQRPHWGQHLLIAGDLNTAPWTPELQTLLRKTNLRDSQLGFGVQPSWPAILPGFKDGKLLPLWLLPLGLPIDHILISPRLDVVSRHTAAFVGSDHLPVVLDFVVGKSPPQTALHSGIYKPVKL
jgi:endonuclease/exonuclease/phosphatase (EEP) superfamily protein YafD